LKLAFLGVAIIKNKGLDFLISALEQCTDTLLSKLHVVLLAKWIYQGAGNRERLSSVSNRLGGLTVKDGYSHGELGELLADVDLGVGPDHHLECWRRERDFIPDALRAELQFLLRHELIDKVRFAMFWDDLWGEMQTAFMDNVKELCKMFNRGEDAIRLFKLYGSYGHERPMGLFCSWLS